MSACALREGQKNVVASTRVWLGDLERLGVHRLHDEEANQGEEAKVILIVVVVLLFVVLEHRLLKMPNKSSYSAV